MSQLEPKIVIDNNDAKSTKPDAPVDSLLHRLVAFEGEALQAGDRLSLKHIAVNKSRILLPLGHAFLCTRSGHQTNIEAVSNQALVNNQAPFIQWMRHILKSMSKGKDARDFSASMTFNLKTRRADDDFDYPFAYAYWAPFSPGANTGGMLFTRGEPWQEAEHPVLDRIGQIVGVNWAAQAKQKRHPLPARKKIIFSSLGLLLLAGLIFPVPMTTLAPAEIMAADPFIITASIDGVIETIHVKPGTMVEKGAVLATLNDTAYRNEYALASEEKLVAKARYRQASLSSFIDENAKRELAIARAEQDLAGARQAYAADRLAKTKLTANRAGLVIYSDEKDWAGRPVAIGEKIMQIANPNRVLLRIESPITASGSLRGGARVRVFLDADPLRPIEAKLTRSNFYAQPQAGGQLAYEAYAALETGGDIPRIGGRGVAKIYGDKAPFGYWLLRRPITSVRQFIGL